MDWYHEFSVKRADTGGKGYAMEKFRDLLKYAVIRYGLNSCFLLIGIENQTNIHFAMTVRNMLYDALSYAEQVLKKGKLHREQKDKMSGGEFLLPVQRG